MDQSVIWAIILSVCLWILFAVLVVTIVRLAIKTFERSPDDLDVRTANARAKELLRELLGDDEYEQLIAQGYLDVTSPSYTQRIYRIPLEDGMVRVFESEKEMLRLCIQPVHPLPRYDVIAMHKLMIEGDEQEYLSRANWFSPRKS